MNDTTTPKRPTLKTIAELTGLAIPTVSRALSGAEDIGKATRARVQQVAKEIGYVPNRAGVRLRTGRTYVISLVLSTEADVMNLTARLINAAAGALRHTQYHLNIAPYFPDEDPMRPIRHIVETRAADAILMNQVAPEDARVRYLMDKGFPFVTHGRSIWADAHDYYDFDNRTFASLAVREMAVRGRKELRLVAPPIDQFYAQEMLTGATIAAAREKVGLKVIPNLTSDSEPGLIEAEMRKQFEANPEIDGVIFASAASCMATVPAAEDAGKTIGSDMDFFSKEAAPFLRRVRSGILTQYEDAWAAGTFLAEAAIARLEKPNSPLRQCLEVPSRD